MGLATAAMAAEPCCGNQAMSMGYGGYAGYCAPACAAPSYGLVPGCCEFPPSCCDHVWDGYCQELRGLDALRALCPYRGCRGLGCGAVQGWGGAACSPVGLGCCEIDSVERPEAGEPPGDAVVEIPVAPIRAH